MAESKNIARMGAASNNVGPEGARAIADALHTNKALKELRLSRSLIGGNGATHAADALALNASLESICAGGFDANGLSGFAALLTTDARWLLTKESSAFNCPLSPKEAAMLTKPVL